MTTTKSKSAKKPKQSVWIEITVEYQDDNTKPRNFNTVKSKVQKAMTDIFKKDLKKVSMYTLD